MAKEPVPGQVKTRLSPPCTPVQAARLAEAALADTLAAVVVADVDRRVLVLDGQPGAWLPDGIEVIAQRGGPFAERLEYGWHDAVGARPGPTVQIGMDTPQITADLLETAFRTLADAAAVIGPAADGGWWALGLHRHLPGVFDGVPMSADDTGRRQEQRITELLGTSPTRLALVRDVDHYSDAIAAAEAAPTTSFAALVEELGL